MKDAGDSGSSVYSLALALVLHRALHFAVVTAALVSTAKRITNLAREFQLLRRNREPLLTRGW